MLTIASVLWLLGGGGELPVPSKGQTTELSAIGLLGAEVIVIRSE